MKKIKCTMDIFARTQLGLLSMTQALVLILILHYDSKGFGYSMCNCKSISVALDKHERTVYNSLMKLRESGLITYDRGVIRLVDEE